MPAEPEPERIDPAAYQEQLDRLGELFSSMIATATEVSKHCCPYRNRHDECTAQFGCRNQRWPEGREGPKLCGGDDKLDYRSAWETTA